MFARFKENKKYWGFVNAIGAGLYRVVQRVVGLHLFVINSRELDAGQAAAAQAGVAVGGVARRVQDADWPQICADPALNISEDFVRAAQQRGDVCIGYFQDDALVSYFWCGFSRVPAQHGLQVRVPAGYSYAYKALTLSSHRGQRLQQVLTQVNDAMLIEAGLRYNIEYIAVDNFAQRKASARYGNTTLGLAGYIKWGQRLWPVRSARVAASGFAFETFAFDD